MCLAILLGLSTYINSAVSQRVTLTIPFDSNIQMKRNMKSKYIIIIALQVSRLIPWRKREIEKSFCKTDDYFVQRKELKIKQMEKRKS